MKYVTTIGSHKKLKSTSLMRAIRILIEEGEALLEAGHAKIERDEKVILRIDLDRGIL